MFVGTQFAPGMLEGLRIRSKALLAQSPLTFESFEFKGNFSLQAPKHKPSMIPLPEDPHILGYNYSDGEF